MESCLLQDSARSLQIPAIIARDSLAASVVGLLYARYFYHINITGFLFPLFIAGIREMDFLPLALALTFPFRPEQTRTHCAFFRTPLGREVNPKHRVLLFTVLKVAESD